MDVSREQDKIIKAEVGDILVSAAAGSGKTFTMTHRIVERVKAKALSIDRVLVLTFTDKAAENMRSRMAQVLHEALLEARPEDKAYLIEQEMRLNSAQISTVHSFCQKIIKAHGQELHRMKSKLRPDAGAVAMEAEEQERLLLQAIDECMMEAYAEADESYLTGQKTPVPMIWQLSDSFGDSKGDNPLRELLASVHAFLRSMPDYELWVTEALDEYRRAVTDFEQSYSAHLRRLWKRALQGLAEMRPILTEAEPPQFKSMKKYRAKTYEENDAIRHQFLLLSDEIEALDLAAEKTVNWDEIHEAGKRMFLPKVDRQGSNPEKLAIVDASRRYLGEFMYFINGSCGTKAFMDHFLWNEAPVFNRTQAEYREEIAKQSARLEAFFALILKCDRRYAELKNEANKIDFSDMEHLALLLVRQPEIKAIYAEKYKEIYIDEYQDTSSIQDCIVMELAQDNLFVVGDIKQSIYRFRHANPKLFATRYEEMRNGLSQQLFELSTNFRSTPAVLRAVNLLFSELMTKGASEIDYLNGHSLGIPEDKLLQESSFASEKSDRAAFNFLIYTDNRTEYEVSLKREFKNKNADESLAICAEMVKLITSGVKSSEIAVLSRTHQELIVLAPLLASFGIEYNYSKEKRLLTSRPLRCVIALLRILENPLQDEYLASVLLHFEPWGKFSEQELLKIKLESLSGEDVLAFNQPFHRALMCYLDRGSDESLRERLKIFWQSFMDLRKRSLHLDVSQLLRVIYEDLGWLNCVALEQEGEHKVEQLAFFAHWAEGFVKVGQNSLYALNAELFSQDDQIEWTEKVLEGERKEEGTGVSLMTFHASKGLEFPYVFICRSDKGKDTKKSGPLIYSQEHGVAVRIEEEGEVPEHPSLLQRYIASREDEAELAEFLRLFYVALTRAEQRIYMCMSMKGMEAAIGFVEKWWEIALEEYGSDVDFTSGFDSNSDSGFNSDFEAGTPTASGMNCPSDLNCPSDWKDSPGLNSPPGLKSAIGLKSASWRLPTWLIHKAAKEGLASLGFLALKKSTSAFWPAILTSANTMTNHIQGDWALFFRDSMDLLQPSLKDNFGAESLEEILGTKDLAGGSREQLLSFYRSEKEKESSSSAYWSLKYPYEQALRTGIKYSVSEIKDKVYQEANQVEEEASGISESFIPRDSSRILRPLNDLKAELEAGVAGSSTRPLNAAERGSALHKILRYLHPSDYLGLSAPKATSLLEEKISAFSSEGFLSPAELEAIQSSRSSLIAFLKSPRAAEIASCELERGRKLYREIPFTLAWSAADLLGESKHEVASEDKVLVQGVVDLWYVVNEKIVVLDFKTDRIAGSDTEVLAELERRYAKQLEL